MNVCIFCKIIKKEIPNYTVYEDANTLAFLDIHPSCKGHTVVVPKAHAETLIELNDEAVKDLFIGVKNAMSRVEEKLHPDGFNVGWNHKSAGGQVVEHLHVHVFPRWKGDGGTSVHAIVKNHGETSVEEIAKLF